MKEYRFLSYDTAFSVNKLAIDANYLPKKCNPLFSPDGRGTVLNLIKVGMLNRPVSKECLSYWNSRSLIMAITMFYWI